MSHCFLKEQYILLLKFLWVSLIFFQIKKKIKKMKSQKKKKKWKQKIFWTQSMSVSDNVSVRQSQDLGNARVR